ncbi:hypothetical protein METH_17535 [Leisingera methylohalidivorans DSM 14336]|uniref:Uncharacterized protein n=1 Tax=Leisingera methylohalidivorans DSM 14336 TaxID=999552 RepID=V9VZ93_9RHOB|nr:hypothetical protein METH_17535 [Leisingera methylohalidivorans DSM 14336]
MQILVPMFGPGFRIRVYADSTRDGGKGSAIVQAGRSIP